MAKEKFFDRILDSLKLKLSELNVELADDKVEEETAKADEVTLQDGIIEIKISYGAVGEPVMSGDKELPDGEYILVDGKTLKVEGGKLAEIVEPVAEEKEAEAVEAKEEEKEPEKSGATESVEATKMEVELEEVLKMSEFNLLVQKYEAALDSQKKKYEEILKLQKENIKPDGLEQKPKSEKDVILSDSKLRNALALSSIKK